MSYDKQLPSKEKDLSGWYNRLVLEAELADYGPAKGTMIFRPYGFALWEEVRRYFDPIIRAKGVENAYFPLFIPESLLKKEKEHVEGFSPELAVVTIGGGEELEEKLVVRPTSETIMYEAYSRWVQSWRDLPLMINQWNNVVRWEKRTYLFLRTSEFLWQEGHTAHASHGEAQEMQMWALKAYEKLHLELLAVPGYAGKKSNAEKFAGAQESLTFETLMPGGKALQGSTSHDLGQNFSKPFNIHFQNQKGDIEYAWQTSWGLSTRTLGGLIMTHGDDAGLVLPPRLAPIQVVILPVKPDPKLLKYVEEVDRVLKEAGLRTKIDDRAGESLGFKINKWELRGVPIRLEVGAKELNERQLTLVRRLKKAGEEKQVLDFSDQTAILINRELESIQDDLLSRARKFLHENTHEVGNYDEFKEIMRTKKGFIKAFWCENPECETKIQTETTATTRCLPLDAKEEKGTCVYCSQPAKHRWLFAQAY